MDTAQNGAGRLVEHANRQGPWLAPGQRSLAGPGIIREFWIIRYFVNFLFNIGSGVLFPWFQKSGGKETLALTTAQRTYKLKTNL